MPAREFHLTTDWTVTATIAEVADILMDPERFPDWWGEVYLGVTLLDRGDADGIGSRIAVHSKGWLPYHLHWEGRLVSSDAPRSWQIAATGDLSGTGVWTLRQDGPIAHIHYDWRVLADRPLFRLLAPVFGPVLAWNHHWAMARGEEGLKRELIRRRSEVVRR